jgi:hypothetical protein
MLAFAAILIGAGIGLTLVAWVFYLECLQPVIWCNMSGPLLCGLVQNAGSPATMGFGAALATLGVVLAVLGGRKRARVTAAAGVSAKPVP